MMLGIQNKPKLYERFIGKYVAVYTQYPQSFSGKIAEITETDEMILNPHQGSTWDSVKGQTIKLIKKDSSIPLSKIVKIDTITKKDLEGYCEYLSNHNNHSKEEKS